MLIARQKRVGVCAQQITAVVEGVWLGAGLEMAGSFRGIWWETRDAQESADWASTFKQPPGLWGCSAARYATEASNRKASVPLVWNALKSAENDEKSSIGRQMHPDAPAHIS